MDFLREPAAPKLGWALLVVGAAALVAASVFARQVDRQLGGAEHAVQVQSDLDAARRQPAKAVPPSIDEIRLRGAEAESRAPWLATLRAIETTTRDPVYLRSLVVEPAAATVKLEAEAPTFAEALSYSKALDDEPLFRPALLTTHEEIVDAATGKSSVHFSVITRWNSR